ncbi:MAG: hypothetical protein JWQ30_1812 [Sediminibacterium sp.]|nr:hypothetical protein [Sediminibacterium sp.]
MTGSIITVQLDWSLDIDYSLNYTNYTLKTHQSYNALLM